LTDDLKTPAETEHCLTVRLRTLAFGNGHPDGGQEAVEAVETAAFIGFGLKRTLATEMHEEAVAAGFRGKKPITGDRQPISDL
jgi:hypothetical protein